LTQGHGRKDADPTGSAVLAVLCWEASMTLPQNRREDEASDQLGSLLVMSR
jgi:hypothetical protein